MAWPLVRVPKKYQHREWQAACKAGRDVYMYGGTPPQSVTGNYYYPCEIFRFNIDTFSMAIHESINKVPLRWGHTLTIYSMS